jgi:hypothetical protein
LLDPDLAAEKALIKAKYKTAGEERRRVEIELSSIEAANCSAAAANNWIEETTEAIRELMAGLSDQETKQQFVRRLVSRAEWDGAEIRMHCALVPKSAQTS